MIRNKSVVQQQKHVLVLGQDEEEKQEGLEEVNLSMKEDEPHLLSKRVLGVNMKKHSSEFNVIREASRLDEMMNSYRKQVSKYLKDTYDVDFYRNSHDLVLEIMELTEDCFSQAKMKKLGRVKRNLVVEVLLKYFDNQEGVLINAIEQQMLKIKGIGFLKKQYIRVRNYFYLEK